MDHGQQVHDRGDAASPESTPLRTRVSSSAAKRVGRLTLAMSDEEVASWPLDERMRRVALLIEDANEILDYAINEYILSEGRSIAGKVVLFSGGHDSTVMAHLMRHRATHAGMANTGIGVEATREFVRRTCSSWGLPLLEHSPDPKDSYESLVLAHGFPGPGHHYKMFQRLKERPFRKIRDELVHDPYRQRLVFLAGRRRLESVRRAQIPEFERVGSIVWVSPIINWTRPDLITYRQMFAVPRNEVADLLHMSGECLCGAFAHVGERDEIEPWFRAPFEHIDWLENAIRERPDIPARRKRWGWSGSNPIRDTTIKQAEHVGFLCGSCPSKALMRSHQPSESRAEGQ